MYNSQLDKDLPSNLRTYFYPHQLVVLELQRKLPTKFEIEVCTIDPMTASFDPSPLIPYVESLGLKYHYVKDNIVERAQKGGKSQLELSEFHFL